MPLPSLLRRPRELLSKLVVNRNEKEGGKGGIVIGGVFCEMMSKKAVGEGKKEGMELLVRVSVNKNALR